MLIIVNSCFLFILVLRADFNFYMYKKTMKQTKKRNKKIKKIIKKIVNFVTVKNKNFYFSNEAWVFDRTKILNDLLFGY